MILDCISQLVGSADCEDDAQNPLTIANVRLELCYDYTGFIPVRRRSIAPCGAYFHQATLHTTRDCTVTTTAKLLCVCIFNFSTMDFPWIKLGEGGVGL